MNKYETVMILDCTISEEDRNNAIEKVKNYIQENGEIEKNEDIGKRKLAYEIKRNKEGYYYIIEFMAEPESIVELERICRITDEILKFIVVRKDD